MTQLTLYPNINQKRLEKIHNITIQKQYDIHNLLDNSYRNTQESHNVLTYVFKRDLMFNKLKTIVRENEFLNNLHEYKRSDPYILKSLIDIINFKDSTGTTPIMKAIEHDDIKTLNYLLKKLTHKINIYNKICPNNKIYLHNILDTKNADNKTALHIAANTNINCYNLILDYMKLNYNNSFEFMLDNMDIQDKQQFRIAFSNSYRLIKNSFSLSVFWNNEHSNTPYSTETLRYNIISNNIYKCKKSLQKLFSESNNITRKKLTKILNIEKLCHKLDNVTTKSPDINLSKLNILTEPDISTGLTPIMQACKNNDFQTLSTLINEIESTKKSLPTDFEYENYLDITDLNYNTALSFAIKNKSIKCINLLLQSGATLGNDFEYTKSDSYILQAIHSKDAKILNLLIQYYKHQHNNVNSLKNYLSATTQKSNYLSPLIVAINNKDIECAMLLFEKYSVPMPEQYKNAYDNLLNNHKKVYPRDKSNFISRIVKNILNSIIFILYFLGIVQVKKSTTYSK